VPSVPLNIQKRNILPNSGIEETDVQISEGRKPCRRPFEVFLQTLASDPDFLRSEARSARDLEIYQTVLSRWQLAGCPSPREWNDKEYLQVGAYLRNWMLYHFEHGFASGQAFMTATSHYLLQAPNIKAS
jgi:hypothetical protein